MYPNALCSMGGFRDSGAGAGAGAELDNFWKRWVRVRRDSAIKKLLKIFLFNFLYIFTIKIFLKNTLLCLDSQKKKKKKASFGFSGHIQGQFRPFPASFSRFRHVLAASRYDPIWPNQPGSTRIEADSARIEPHRHESSRISANWAESARIWEKKKKTQTLTDARATTLDAASHVGRGCDTSGAASVLSS